MCILGNGLGVHANATNKYNSVVVDEFKRNDDDEDDDDDEDWELETSLSSIFNIYCAPTNSVNIQTKS